MSPLLGPPGTVLHRMAGAQHSRLLYLQCIFPLYIPPAHGDCFVVGLPIIHPHHVAGGYNNLILFAIDFFGSPFVLCTCPLGGGPNRTPPPPKKILEKKAYFQCFVRLLTVPMTSFTNVNPSKMRNNSLNGIGETTYLFKLWL